MTRPKATTADKMQQAHERLTHAVEPIVSGEDWQRMLKVASRAAIEGTQRLERSPADP